MNGIAGGTVTGQEAGGTKGRCGDFCWPVTIQSMSEINRTTRKTVIADSSSLNL
jgi:hypothetical protein